MRSIIAGQAVTTLTMSTDSIATAVPVWVMLRAQSGGPGLSLQYEPNFVRVGT